MEFPSSLTLSVPLLDLGVPRFYMSVSISNMQDKCLRQAVVYNGRKNWRATAAMVNKYNDDIVVALGRMHDEPKREKRDVLVVCDRK